MNTNTSCGNCQRLQVQVDDLQTQLEATQGDAQTLREQLDEAVAREDYEQAARLRDMIRAQTRARR